jgi:AmmeMemoRadiSam system protein A
VITPDDQRCLLQLARRALEARVRGEDPPAAETSAVAACGAFVTITRAGALRGCLGRLEADAGVTATVAHLAAAVADSDPRFEPVHISELADLAIEISLLTPEREVRSIDEIDVGRHGLIVEQGFRRGLLLPQVASERGWDRETFLAHTCIKAGLAPEAWRHGVRILIFEADVFAETAG